ncbi:MAG: hypothetical protein ACYC0B_02125 [Gemmatimonadaceae bacterium]
MLALILSLRAVALILSLLAVALLLFLAVRALRRAEQDDARPFTGAPSTPDPPTKRRGSDQRPE